MNKNSNKNIWWVGGIGVLLIGLVVWLASTPKTIMKVADNPVGLPGIQTSEAPWAPEISNLSDRLKAIGLPALSAEGGVLHIHQHLDLYIDGKSVAAPAGIGINQVGGFISDVHVHDDSGIINIESPKVQTFTLGQFFDIWGVSFTSINIGGYKNEGNKTLKVFVNGVLYTGDPRGLALESKQEIVVAYGADTELPSPIPATYIFPAGY